MRDDGRVALSRLYGIAESVARLRQQGKDVLMVSSGAVGLGMERMGLADRPTELSRIQACAAIGQSRLMAIYDDAFDKLGCRAAQVLLTEDDFRDPERYSNLRSTLASLLAMGVIPVINENDTVSTVELDHPTDPAGRERVFGDNDKLSALVMTHVEGNLLLLLSDVDGLYSGDPLGDAAELISQVPVIDEAVRNFAQGKNGRGTRRHGKQAGSRSDCYRSEWIRGDCQRPTAECDRASVWGRSSRNIVSPAEQGVMTPVREAAERAKAASRLLGTIPSDRRSSAIRAAAAAIERACESLLETNDQRRQGGRRDAGKR